MCRGNDVVGGGCGGGGVVNCGDGGCVDCY